ncbi:MAG: hypothetical protein ACYC5X_16520, partial [Syntrophales bacterium]
MQGTGKSGSDSFSILKIFKGLFRSAGNIINRLHFGLQSNNLPLPALHYTPSPTESRQDNSALEHNPRLILQLTCCLRQPNATAIPRQCPCKHEIPSFDPPCGVDNNREWRRYIFTYYHDGAQWDLVIPAWSKEDAQARINKLPFAQYVG